MFHLLTIKKKSEIPRVDENMAKQILLLHLCSVLSNSLQPLNCSPPGSFIHRISPARILEWVPISFSKGSSWPRNPTHFSWVSCIAGGFFITKPPGKPLMYANRMQTSKNSLQNNVSLSYKINVYRTWNPTILLLVIFSEKPLHVCTIIQIKVCSLQHSL